MPTKLNTYFQTFKTDHLGQIFMTGIHTFEVIGPEFSVILTGGTPNTDVPIQAWVFFH